MRRIPGSALAVLAVFTAEVLMAQTRITPTAPGTPGDPVWQGTLRANDGRTFVTDGGLLIDAAFAKPATIPDRTFPPKLLDDYLSTPYKDEYGFSDLTAAPSGKTYTAPNGIALNATYINFLRRVLPPGAVRFRIGGGLQPIVILANGTAVGVLMAVRP
jgi:hypothetical protein